MRRLLLTATFLGLLSGDVSAEDRPQRSVSGIYPHLAMFNDEGECGTGAVVPWQDSLWVVTYAPHMPKGSSDKLYEVSKLLEQTIRPESIGGTPANRMIHRESRQLFIGPYAIDAEKKVRAIPYDKMFGRPTGNARHLTDPGNRIYFATMEEGLYEVDVHTLAVKELWADEQQAGRHAGLPGYHGKGLYSGFGQIIYANNGEHGSEALKRPDVPSGVLASWDGTAPEWTIVRRNQFTEVTGPGGIEGSAHPETDPLWSIGWDHRSLILMALADGKWSTYRLPKGSHSYDGAHGWNTEWPRIRNVGEDQPDYLMTMHGTFWKFPGTFHPKNSSGIVPRSNYLKVIGDFCNWEGRIVFGCDDTAKNEFLNKRPAKGEIAGPGQSQSNLWFVNPQQLDQFGPVIGRGGVWLKDDLKSSEPSDPYLFTGYEYRSLHLVHAAKDTVTFTLEVDRDGTNDWTTFERIEVPPGQAFWRQFDPSDVGVWLRLTPDRDCPQTTAIFQYRNRDSRGNSPEAIASGLARPGSEDLSGGVIHARGGGFKTLRYIAHLPKHELGCYDLDSELNLKRVDDFDGQNWTRKAVAIPTGVVAFDAASIMYHDGKTRWRIPRGSVAFDQPGPLGAERVCREVCTERDLFNAGGTFFELPAENAGGFAKVRPVATHNLRVQDYATYRGLLVLTGVENSAQASEHIVRSDDGRCALWVGTVDDLWHFGKPRGEGGPWKNSDVVANVPSDPYLLTGYDHKELTLSQDGDRQVTFSIEVDLTGNGDWVSYNSWTVPPRSTVKYQFPDAFSGYWLRIRANRDTQATAWLRYW